MAEEVEDGGIPPLEDMSGVLEKMGFCDPKAAQNGSSGSQMPLDTQCDKASTSLSQQTDSVGRPRDPKNPSGEPSKQTKQKPKPKTSSHTSSGGMFGGMKKGFLLSSNASASKISTTSKQAPSSNSKVPTRRKTASSTESGSSKSSNDEIPFLRGQPSQAKKDGLVFPEVQEALKSSRPLLDNKDWVTEDLLRKVQSNPTLAKHMGDPEFMKVLEEFHSNPTAAMQRYSSNPEMNAFLKEFCDLMGSHFTQLADKEDQASSSRAKPKQEPLLTAPTKESPAAFVDDKEVQELLQDQDVQQTLLDPRMQKFVMDMKANPELTQRNLKQASPEIKKMVSLLVSKGLLSFQM